MSQLALPLQLWKQHSTHFAIHPVSSQSSNFGERQSLTLDKSHALGYKCNYLGHICIQWKREANLFLVSYSRRLTPHLANISFKVT